MNKLKLDIQKYRGYTVNTYNATKQYKPKM